MDSRTLIVVFLIIVSIILAGVAFAIASNLNAPDTDSSAYDTPSVTATVTQTATVTTTTTVTATVTQTATPTTTVVISSPTPTVTPSPTIPVTAIISDEADRVLIRIMLIVSGFLAIKLNAYQRVIDGYFLFSAGVSQFFIERSERKVEESKKDFESKISERD